MPTKVTDPNILALLEQETAQPVTDPQLIALLEGQAQAPPQPSTLTRLARPTLEMGGSMAGFAAGLPLAPATFGLAPLVGAGLMYGAGRQAANLLEQGMGERQQQPLGQELAAAAKDVGVGTLIQTVTSGLGGAAQMIGPTFRGLLSRLPGAGRAAQQHAAETVQALPGQLTRPVIPSAVQQRAGTATPTVEQLYTMTAKMNPQVKMAHLDTALRSLRQTEQSLAAKFPSLSKTGILDTINELDRALIAGKGKLAFADIQPVLKRLGQRTASLRGSNDPGATELLGHYKALIANIHSDFDAATAKGGAAAIQTLRAANAAAKHQFATEELADVVGNLNRVIVKDGHMEIPRSVGIQFQKNTNYPYVDAKGIWTAIKGKQMEQFRRSISPDEMMKIDRTLQEINKLPSLPPPGPYGSGQRVGRGALTAGTAMLTGLDPLTAEALGLLAAGGDVVITKALLTETGRNLMMKLFKEQGSRALTPGVMTMLAGAVGTQAVN